MTPSIFLDFTLPNSTSWFYFALFLTISLFFNFSRPFSLRNFDLLALFLFVPGLLLVQESKQIRQTQTVADVPSLTTSTEIERVTARADSVRSVGYLWLFTASGYWIVRCLIDLAMAKRPLPTANLSRSALIFFTLALLLCLAAVTFRRPLEPETQALPQAQTTKMDANTPLSNTEKNAAPGMVAPGMVAPGMVARGMVARGLTVIGQIVVMTGLILIGARHFSDLSTGVMAASLFLLLPYTAYAVGRPDHIWPGAMLVWAIFLYRSPILAGILLGVAGALAVFPFVLLPAWLQLYRGRGAGRFLGAALFAGITVLAMLWLLAMLGGEGVGGYFRFATLENWLPWLMPQHDSLWTGTHWAYRLPIVMVYMAFVVSALFWPPVRDLGDLIAFSAALILGTQFWITDHGGEYVLWSAPLLVLLVLRPNLLDMQPPLPKPLPRWLTFGLFRRASVDTPREPLPA